MKTIKRPNPPPTGWAEIEIRSTRGKNEVKLRIINVSEGFITTVPMPIGTARELAQAILEEIQ